MGTVRVLYEIILMKLNLGIVAGNKNIALLEKLPQSGHLLGEVGLAPPKVVVVVVRHICLPLVHIVLLFDVAAGEGIVVTKRNIWMPLQHQYLVINS